MCARVHTHTRACLMASFHENMDKMVLECQTTLGFTASREMVKVMMVTTGAGSKTNKKTEQFSELSTSEAATARQQHPVSKICS